MNPQKVKFFLQRHQQQPRSDLPHVLPPLSEHREENNSLQGHVSDALWPHFFSEHREDKCTRLRGPRFLDAVAWIFDQAELFGEAELVVQADVFAPHRFPQSATVTQA